MKAKKETLKENVLTDIDELMDSLFGKPGTPERERFREEASIKCSCKSEGRENE
jgi:hypothetical protein